MKMYQLDYFVNIQYCIWEGLEMHTIKEGQTYQERGIFPKMREKQKTCQHQKQNKILTNSILMRTTKKIDFLRVLKNTKCGFALLG